MTHTPTAALIALALAAPAQTLATGGMPAVSLATRPTLRATAPAPAAVQGEKPADVNGVWAFTIDTGNGTGTPTVTFKQDGEKLTGHYSSQVLGERDFTGTVKGNAINFVVEAEVQGQAVKVAYSGTVDKDTMKGKVVLGELGEGTFTGKKK